MAIETMKELIKKEILVSDEGKEFANTQELRNFVNNLTDQCDELYRSKKDFGGLKNKLAKYKLKIKAEPINLLTSSGERTYGLEFLSFFKHNDETISGGKLFAAAEELGPEYVKALDVIALWELLACLTNGKFDDGNKCKPVTYFHINISKELLEEERQRNLLIVLSCLKDYIVKKLKGVPILEISEKLNNIYNDITIIWNLWKKLNMRKASFFAWDDTFYIEKTMSRVPVVYHLEFYDQTKFLKIDYKFFQELYNKRTFFTSVFENLLEIDRYFYTKRRTKIRENLLIFEGVEDRDYKAMLRNYLKRGRCLIQGHDVYFNYGGRGYRV